MCNTTKTKLQCSGHIYNHSFGTIKHYTTYAPVELHKTKQLPPFGKNICVSRLKEDLLMLPSVLNHGYQIMPLNISYILTHLKKNVL